MDSEKLVLSWKNVQAWTRPTLKVKKPIQLLSNVYGMAQSGSLLAIVSPSGAGKTTLLAALNGRYKGIQEGDIRLNGRLTSPEQMAIDSGFACQKHYVFEEMTVMEHLEFMARLKMDKHATDEERLENVLKILENLGMSHRMTVRISALSGGQRKRLALAVQLITKPKILFCDEPTTGLDSYSAVNVVKMLRFMADQGKMIICSIHQPTSGIFQMFDDVSLLASGGTLAYHGPVAEISDYFAKLGLKCPEAFDLSEYIVSQVTIRPPSVEGSYQDSEKVDRIVKYYHQSELPKLEKYLESIQTGKTQDDVVEYKRISRVSFNVEFVWLLWRTALILKRSYKTLIMKFFLYWWVFACISLPYGVVAINQTGVQNIQGLLNCLVIEIMYCSMYSVIFTFPDELPIFVQESVDRSYSPLSYYLSKLIVLTLKCLVDTFFYSNFVLGVTGLNRNPMDFIVGCVPVLLLSLVSAGYGFFLSTAFDSVTTFSLFSVPFELVSGTFTGLIIRLNSLPWYTAWLKYLSFPFYAYESLCVEQWNKFKYIECDKEDISECYLSGDQVLAAYGFDKNETMLDYGGLMSFFLVFHILGFFFLLRKIKYSAAY